MSEVLTNARAILCAECHGLGMRTWPADTDTCRHCNGSGVQRGTCPGAAIRALGAGLKKALDEVERLTRVLRVEQGDESAAPPGWHTKSDRIVTVWHRGPWSVYRHRPGMWRVFLAGTSGWTGEHRTALEAMEATDRAAGGAA